MNNIEKQINEYLWYCEKVLKRADSTLESKRYTLNQFAKDTGVESFCDVDNTIINQWIAKQGSESAKIYLDCVSRSTIKKRLIEIRTCIKYLKEMEYCIPTKIALLPKIKADKIKRVWYTKEQIEEVIETATEKEKLMILLAFYSGMRLSELRNIRVNDIDMINRTIFVIGKGNKPADVFIKEGLVWPLAQYIEQNNLKSNDYLWQGKWKETKDKPLSKAAMTMTMRRAFLRAGFDDFHPHALRHSFATNLQRNGTPIDVIKELMRHDSTTTTDVYLHHFNQFLISDYDKYIG